ncbi:winged helix-turn-helix domain-containing protein [Streptomyces noursei]|uniref:winged helix-turn-helix domain-containing protein n=1 Tax=Streptomyces noursei TaxID=1971 RepID=UPI0021A8A4ED|nr:winged helix-turn-helix domain-containing protein [Streptomyces noursei]UWS70169.1 winged helix-turn-helix domain-containing protein [Streptomyces noursei]
MEEMGLTCEGRLQREKLRLQAAEWFEEGIAQAEIARLLGTSRQAVHVWHKKWKNGGTQALRSSGPSGRRPLVSEDEFTQVAEALKQGPAAHGFTGGGWTLARIRRVIKEATGAEYTSPSGVWRLLKRHGWSRQTPTRRAYERDEKAVMTWRSEVWPQVKPQPSTAEQ